MNKNPRLSTVAALWKARDGIAAIEFALVAPVLVLILAGTVSLGLGLRTKMEVGNAARAGTSYASAHGFDQSKITAAAQNATALTNLTVTATQAAASCMNPASGAITSATGSPKTCPSGSPPGTYVIVTTQLPSYTYILSVPGTPATTPLNGLAVARIQ